MIDTNISENYIKLKAIEEIITNKKHIYDNNNDTYIRRYRMYPEFLLMPYWEVYFETVYMLNCPYLQGKVLDFGCGTGHLDIILAKKGFNVTGIDISTIAIDIANLFRSDESEEVKERTKFYIEDVTGPASELEKFDFCFSTHVFEHIKEPGPIIEGLRRRLKKDAYMLMSVPLGYAYNDPDHVHHFMNEEELRAHFDKYVKVIKVDRHESDKVLKIIVQF